MRLKELHALCSQGNIKRAYRYSKWGYYFDNIVEFDATNIRNIVAEPEVQENARYAVNGQRLTAPVKGINLVKYNNGRVKKEIVK